MKKSVFGMMISLLLPLTMAAQSGVTTVPYTMSFEKGDAAELAELGNWVLNPGAQASACIDKWYVGNQLHNDGSFGLYISNDGENTTGYGNIPCVQYVYRDFQLENGTYYISFDYIAPNQDGKLYVGVLSHVGNTNATNAMVAINNPISGVAQLPAALGVNYRELTASATWANDSWEINGYTNPTNGQVREARLFFAWVSNATDSVQGIAAAIDNVQINHGDCLRPENLVVNVVNCDSVLLTWDGSSSRYQAEYRKIGSNNWRKRTVRDGAHEVALENVQEGNYDFRVRGICYRENEDNTVDTLYSPYTFLSNVNIFCPDKHCINYVAINDTNVARCTYGTTGSAGYYQLYQQAFATEGVVDFGSESINSRHTVNWDTLATDPRTNDQLRLVPRGESASIRLGNWDYNYGAEAITYDFYVDPDNSILLLKYAIVLEDPDGHGDDAMPRFVLQVFDEDGLPLDSTCGRVDLNPLNEDASWNHTTPGDSYTPVVWKDWSMMGLNLDNYVGRRLKVSVATYDCFWSAHYGYAYFTMGCASAHIKNTSCGAQQSVEVEAPEGFSYLWSNEVNTLKYTDRNITIGLNDPTNWKCTLTSLENKDCSFELYVNTEPRYPMADFTVTYEPKNCENRYVFENKSFIRTNVNGQIKDNYDEECDFYTWDFGFDGEESDAKDPGVMIFPEEGGTFYVSLTAMIGDGTGSCRDEKIVKLEVPALSEHRARWTETICDGNYVNFHGQRLFDAGTYYFGGPDEKTGCLAIDTLDLVVIPKSEPRIESMQICYGDTVLIADSILYSPRLTSDTTFRLLNQYGCDSMIVFHVAVSPQIVPAFAVQEVDEEHDAAYIDVTGIGFSGFVFEGKRYEGDAVKLDGLDGGLYDFSFYNADSCWLDTTIQVGNGCLRNLVYQRWNDVLSIKNSSLIGGMEFDSFQWTFEGEDIAGATRSYYYAPEGLRDGIYTCRVRVSGSLELSETCSFRPVLKSVEKAPTRKEMRDGTLYIVREDKTFDVYGNCVK